MIKWALGIVTLCLASQAFATSERLNRTDKIWAAVNDRFATQIDVWFEDGEFPQTIQILKFQSDLFPSDYEIWTNLGWMEENVKEWADAETTYKTFQASNPKEPDAQLPLATYYFNRKQYEKLPPLLESAVKRPCHPNNYRILARSYEKLGKLDDAKRVLKLQVARFPKDLQAIQNLKRIDTKLAAKG